MEPEADDVSVIAHRKKYFLGSQIVNKNPVDSVWMLGVNIAVQVRGRRWEMQYQDRVAGHGLVGEGWAVNVDFFVEGNEVEVVFMR
jgi:hypothetical protein